MTDDPIEVLDELADAVAEEFEAYRQPDQFKDVSIVIEDSNPNHPTLIIHVTREDATSLADEIVSFLEQQGARTERESYAENDVRVLATMD